MGLLTDIGTACASAQRLECRYRASVWTRSLLLSVLALGVIAAVDE
jgi:hypothetical protein